MTKDANARLIAVGGDGQYHYVHFQLEFGRVKARISIEVEGPAPCGNRIEEYRSLLHRVGVHAQDVAGSPNALSYPDRWSTT